uniref:uncharacterized protein n=1 Tax=Myxine glutinosa TaxID=7769 RepID=UPI00358F8447
MNFRSSSSSSCHSSSSGGMMGNIGSGGMIGHTGCGGMMGHSGSGGMMGHSGSGGMMVHTGPGAMMVHGGCSPLMNLQAGLHHAENHMKVMFERFHSSGGSMTCGNMAPMMGFGSAMSSCDAQSKEDLSRYQVAIDMGQIKPENMVIKVIGNKLQVCGRHEMKKEDGKGGFSYSNEEFCEYMTLPEDVDPNSVTCAITNGQMNITSDRLSGSCISKGSERLVPIAWSQVL